MIEEFCMFCEQITYLQYGYSPLEDIFNIKSKKFDLNVKILDSLISSGVKFKIFSNKLTRTWKINNIILNKENLSFFECFYRKFKSYCYTFETDYFDLSLVNTDLSIKDTIYDIINEQLPLKILEEVKENTLIPYNLVQEILVSSYTDPIVITVKSRFAVI